MVNRKPLGRPVKIDQKMIQKLSRALQYGANVTRACDYAGISRDTYYRYMRDDVLFAEEIKKARNNRAPIEWL